MEFLAKIDRFLSSLPYDAENAEDVEREKHVERIAKVALMGIGFGLGTRYLFSAELTPSLLNNSESWAARWVRSYSTVAADRLNAAYHTLHSSTQIRSCFPLFATTLIFAIQLVTWLDSPKPEKTTRFHLKYPYLERSEPPALLPADVAIVEPLMVAMRPLLRGLSLAAVWQAQKFQLGTGILACSDILFWQLVSRPMQKLNEGAC